MPRPPDELRGVARKLEAEITAIENHAREIEQTLGFLRERLLDLGHFDDYDDQHQLLITWNDAGHHLVDKLTRIAEMIDQVDRA